MISPDLELLEDRYGESEGGKPGCTSEVTNGDGDELPGTGGGSTSLDGMLDPAARNLRRATPESSKRGRNVQQLHDGQCGLCAHFGETHPQTDQITAIRTRHQAPEELLDDCGHPRHA